MLREKQEVLLAAQKDMLKEQKEHTKRKKIFLTKLNFCYNRERIVVTASSDARLIDRVYS